MDGWMDGWMDGRVGGWVDGYRLGALTSELQKDLSQVREFTGFLCDKPTSRLRAGSPLSHA